MNWIEHLERTSINLNDTENTLVYEFLSECFIPGQLNYENEKIQCRGLFPHMRPYGGKHGMNHYTIHISREFHEPNPQDSWKWIQEAHNNATSKGYYFSSGMCGELLSLFSLFFQCRLYLYSEYQISKNIINSRLEHNFLYHKCDPIIHPKVFNTSERNFVYIEPFLNKVRTLPSDKHQRFILACNQYARALKSIGIDSEMVYIRLVSAVEALSKNHKLSLSSENNSSPKLLGKNFEDLFESAKLESDQKEELRKILDVNKENIICLGSQKAQEKFIAFVKQFSETFPFKKGSEHIYVLQENLGKVLKDIYHSRSLYLHQGEAIFISRPLNFENDWDYDSSAGGIYGNREVTGKLPHPYWFEDIVRHCLMTYLEENSK